MRLTVAGHETYAYTGARPLVATQPTVVFVHGAAHDHSIWALQSRYVAHHGSNVLAVDLPGHGRSDGAPLASIGAIAAWLVALLDAAGVECAAVVGHSMGALAGLETAARYPARVRKVALLGPSVPMPVSDALLAACHAYADGLDAAARVTCPTLVILGERDLMAPARNARALLAALPDVRTVSLRGAGHALMTEQPDAVLDALRTFL